MTGLWLYQTEEGRSTGLEHVLERLKRPVINVMPPAREQCSDQELPELRTEPVLTEWMGLLRDNHLAILLVDNHSGIIDWE